MAPRGSSISSRTSFRNLSMIDPLAPKKKKDEKYNMKTLCGGDWVVSNRQLKKKSKKSSTKKGKEKKQIADEPKTSSNSLSNSFPLTVKKQPTGDSFDIQVQSASRISTCMKKIQRMRGIPSGNIRLKVIPSQILHDSSNRNIGADENLENGRLRSDTMKKAKETAEITSQPPFYLELAAISLYARTPKGRMILLKDLIEVECKVEELEKLVLSHLTSNDVEEYTKTKQQGIRLSYDFMLLERGNSITKYKIQNKETVQISFVGGDSEASSSSKEKVAAPMNRGFQKVSPLTKERKKLTNDKSQSIEKLRKTAKNAYPEASFVIANDQSKTTEKQKSSVANEQERHPTSLTRQDSPTQIMKQKRSQVEKSPKRNPHDEGINDSNGLKTEVELSKDRTNKKIKNKKTSKKTRRKGQEAMESTGQQCEQGVFKINVLSWYGDLVEINKISSDSSIDVVKEKLSRKINLPATNLKLLRHGDELRINQMTLRDYGIKNNETLLLEHPQGRRETESRAISFLKQATDYFSYPNQHGNSENMPQSSEMMGVKQEPDSCSSTEPSSDAFDESSTSTEEERSSAYYITNELQSLTKLDKDIFEATGEKGFVPFERPSLQAIDRNDQTYTDNEEPGSNSSLTSSSYSEYGNSDADDERNGDWDDSITVITPDFTPITIPVDTSSTIKEIRWYVARVLDMPVSQIRLSKCNDEHTLEDSFRPPPGEILTVQPSNVVVKMPDCSKLELSVFFDTQVGDVKDYIQEKTGFKRSKQRICFDGDNNADLNDTTPIDSDCTLKMYIRGEIPIMQILSSF